MDASENRPGGAVDSLIGPDDPPPFAVLDPDGAAPVVLICDHASRAMPAAMGTLGVGAEALDRHIAWDIGARELTERLSLALDAPAVLAGYSRLLVDLNRQPGDPESIAALSDGTPVPANRDLSEAEQSRRIESFFWPYHHAVTNTLAHVWRRGTAPALISIHSFTPFMNGEQRPWDIGILWNRDPRLAVPMIEMLRRVPGLTVGDNEPYSGLDCAYTIDVHGAAAGLPNVVVEVRQDQLADTEGVAWWCDTLGRILADILAMENLHRVEHF